MGKISPSIRDPRDKLIAALDVIEKFTKKSSIKKIMDFARDLVSSAFNDEMQKKFTQKRNKLANDVWRAVDDVHRYHPLVLMKEDDETKALATRALESISKFNHVISKSEKGWRRRLMGLLMKRSGLPKKIEVNLLSQASKVMQEASIFSRINWTKHAIKQEEDLFRMRAFSLLNNQPELFPSSKKALSALNNSPIYVISSNSDIQPKSVVLLEQHFSPFPGKTIVLKGAFIRKADSLTPSIPILDSFKLASEYNQTGFPHPAQNTGWALSEFLVPVHPLRPNEMKITASILQDKNKLLEKAYFEKIKNIFWNREACIIHHEEEYLLLQKRLVRAIVQARGPLESAQNDVIENFFNWLRNQSSIYSVLSDIYSRVNENFIGIPYKKLVCAWVEQENRNLLSNEPKICFLAARLILEVARKEVIEGFHINDDLPEQLHAFMLMMGKIFGEASDRLILQHLSEVMEFPPPFFTEFEKKLQAASFRQLQDFTKECMNDDPKITFNKIKNTILSDIDLFEQKFVRYAIVDELEQYYEKQFNS